MEYRYGADPARVRQMNNQELRDSFVFSGLFRPGALKLGHSEIDRAIVGGAVPLKDGIDLPVVKEIAAGFFCERREIGVVNIGGEGSIGVDGAGFEMENRDSLYIGRGSRDIRFFSKDPSNPAKFYLVSYPAHAAYPCKRVRRDEANILHLGSQERCNVRTIFQSIRPGIVETCQVVLGFTQLATGSIWNTMPPHTHRRRSEIYMYFDLPEAERVFHIMGEPGEIRTIVMADGEAVASPSWSMHCGAGTSAYTFVWSMGGENQEFDDMDAVKLEALG